ncbi:MAG TPA: 4a-hydroxytetrahydrobiopterin dehydratase [Steroidobacteraceae bacterium]
MSDLTQKKCVACEGGVDPLTREQAQALMSQIHPEWRLSDDGKRIQREWKFRNFFHTMSFVNAVAHIANAEDHHPDMEVGYGWCRLTYTTHAIDGLSENDFICAAKVDQLPKT